jgi:guanine nucleotide-binding protein G(i) subunit alpha
MTKLYEWTVPGFSKEDQKRRQETLEAKLRSQRIDRFLEEDFLKKLQHDCHILILGPGGNGMSEVIKKMKSIGREGYSKQELESYRLPIYRTVVNCAESLVIAMESLKVAPENQNNKEHCEFILKFSAGFDNGSHLDAEFCKAFTSIWNDPCIPRLLEHTDKLDLLDLIR